jgi:hypothetical protein
LASLFPEMAAEKDIDATSRPVIKKSVKSDVVKRLLKRSVCGIYHDNPLGTLNSLVEVECFHLDVISHEKSYRGRILIDGKKFECVANQKKKARDMVVVKALEYIFADVIREIHFENEKHIYGGRNGISSSTTINLGLQPFAANVPEILPSPIGENHIEEVAKKTEKRDSIDSCASNQSLVIKKEIRSHILERVVEQALGFTSTENPNTVTALYSLFDKDSFYFQVKPLPGNETKFSANLFLQGRSYTDVGPSMKKSKSNVTKKALKDLFPEIASRCSDEDRKSPQSDQSTEELSHINGNGHNGDTNGFSSLDSFDLPKKLNFSDLVASTIQSKYDEIMAPYAEHLRRYSVLSGIVMVNTEDMTKVKVISICTGKTIFFIRYSPHLLG